MADNVDILAAIAAALDPIRKEIDGIQIYGFFNQNPTPPSIDVYPGDPFQTGAAFGASSTFSYWTIRARATTADHESGQRVLLKLLNRDGPTSVLAAVTADQTLGGVVDSCSVVDDGISGYTEFMDDIATGGRLLGCTWRLEVLE